MVLSWHAAPSSGLGDPAWELAGRGSGHHHLPPWESYFLPRLFLDMQNTGVYLLLVIRIEVIFSELKVAPSFREQAFQIIFSWDFCGQTGLRTHLVSEVLCSVCGEVGKSGSHSG